MRFLLIAFLVCIPGFIKAEDRWPDRDSLSNLYAAAVQGESNSQLLMGLLYELGYGVPQNFEEAANWYFLAAHNENKKALRRLGILMFLGKGVPKNEILGMLLSLLVPQDDFLESFTSEQKAMIKNSLFLWSEVCSERCQASLIAQNSSYRRNRNLTSTNKIPHMLIADRWDPSDANERIYGPGTGDWNKGILRSDYEQMQRNCQDLMAQISEFQDWSDEKRSKDVQAQVDRLLAESSQYRSDAYREFLFAVGAAIGAGVGVSIPPVPLFSAYEAIEGFKEAARDYVKSIDIEKDAQRLLDIERSLERASSFGGRE